MQKVTGSSPVSPTKRTVAQPGSAFAWGAKGLGFKSRRSDHRFFYDRLTGLSFLLQHIVCKIKDLCALLRGL